LDPTASRPRIPAVLADPEFRKWIRVLGWAFAAPFLFLIAILGYHWIGLPPLEELERIAPSLITRMYDKDSSLIREFYVERRVWTPLERVPKTQIDAVLAIEDRDFFNHSGVDLKAIPASLLPALTGGRVRGGSTLTQQLAKLLFLGPERSLSRKIKEMLLAVRIERTYTKREILEFYLNQVYLGAGAHGFTSAAERYFSLSLDSLDLSRQALLAGLMQRPEALRPDRFPEAALARRNTVLRAMSGTGAVGRARADSASALPLELRMKSFEPLSGVAAAYFVGTVRKEIEESLGKGFLDSAGTRIYTTLDSRAQEAVDSILARHLEAIQQRLNVATMQELGMPGRLRKSQARILGDWEAQYGLFDSLFLRKDTLPEKRRFPEHARYRRAQGAVVVIENGTGAVRALAGGRDWRESEFNRATMAARSPGSAFKPIVYAAAVEKGLSPGDRVTDLPVSIPDPDDTAKSWRPHNLEHDYEGEMSARRAFYRSRNIPAIHVAMGTGLDTVAAFASRFGITRPMRPVPALALGACEASPMEMTAAFSVFPNGGELVRPRFIESILDRTGSPMGRGEPVRTRVIAEASAWILSGLLRDVNIRGTAADVWAGGFRHPSGGKTGTTNDYRDAWYIGFTKRYTVGVWIGIDDHAPMGAGHTGTDDAMPVWVEIMRALHKGGGSGDFEKDFPRPQGVSEVRICGRTGRAARAFCDSTLRDYRVAGFDGRLAPCLAGLHSEGGEEGTGSGDTAGRAPRRGSVLEGIWKKLRTPF
jgi:penicillin-binding protein 1A